MAADRQEIFIIGGAQIYKLAMPHTDRLYLTLVDREYKDADAYFPDYSKFKKVVHDEPHESGGYRYRFLELWK